MTLPIYPFWEYVCPWCPLCGNAPALCIGDGVHVKRIWACGEDDCQVLFWDPDVSASENLSNPAPMVEVHWADPYAPPPPES